jgi:Cu/Ag efflux protein CusF
MKKMMIVTALTVLIALTLSMVAIAQEQLKVKGKVTKIDMATKSVTIKPKSGAEITVVMEDASKLADVKEDDKREATYMIVDGRNVCSKLRRFSGGCD